MSDLSIERENQETQNVEAQDEVVKTAESDANVENFSAEATVSNENLPETDEASKEKKSKKKLVRNCAISAAIVVVAIVLSIIFIPSKFDRVEDECCKIAGQVGTGKNYFSLDTDPYEDMSEAMRAILLPGTQERTLEAIKHANNELGFPGSVYSDMMKTTSLMGRLSEENSKYKVTWTFHPDHGLEVTYSKK